VIGATSEWWRDSCELRARSLAPLVKARGFGMTPLGAQMQVTRALKGALFTDKNKIKGSGQGCPLHTSGVKGSGQEGPLHTSGVKGSGQGGRSGGAESGGLRDDGCRRQFLFREAFPVFASNFLAFDFSFRSNQEIRRHWRNFGG